MVAEFEKNISISNFVLAPHDPITHAERVVLIAMLALSGIVLLIIGIYYILNPRAVIGDSLVNTPNGAPLEIPPTGTFPFYVKPITIFFVAAIVFSYSLFGLAYRLIKERLPSYLRVLLLVVSLTAFAICAYETLFNFALWGSILVNQANPDSSINSFPAGGNYEINLVFATKSFVAYLFVSFFALSTFKRSVENVRA